MSNEGALIELIRTRAKALGLELTPLEVAELLWLHERVGFHSERAPHQLERQRLSPPARPLEEPQESEELAREEETLPPTWSDSSDSISEDATGTTEVAFASPTRGGHLPGEPVAKRQEAQVAVLPALDDRIGHARAIHRLAARRRLLHLREVDIERSVANTAAAGLPFLAFRAVERRVTHLVLLTDLAGQLAPWARTFDLLRDLARQVGSFASVETWWLDLSDPGEARIYGDADGGRPISNEALARGGEDRLVLVLSDAVGPAVASGALGLLLRKFPAGARVNWLHPWHEALWERTQVSLLRAARPLPLPGPTSGGRVTVAMVPFSAKGLQLLEPWAHGRRGRDLRGFAIPTARRQLRRSATQDHRSVSPAEGWPERVRRIRGVLNPEALRIASLAAAIPGNVDVDLLLALCQWFEVPEPQEWRQFIAEAMTSGFLERVPNIPRSEGVFLRFASEDARRAVLAGVDSRDVISVLQRLAERCGTCDSRATAKNLNLPVALLLRFAGGLDAEVPEEAEDMAPESVALLATVLRSVLGENVERVWQDLVAEGSNAMDWRKDFGLERRKPPSLFTGKKELSLDIPQAHLLRRAFDVLKVDGILCVDHSPLVYFKKIDRMTPELGYKLHLKFWNHGGAPVLVVVSDDHVHVYSGMTRPTPIAGDDAGISSLVETLNRATRGVRELVTAIESGDFFRRHQRSFDPTHRVDRDLLENLKYTREKLNAASRRSIPVLDALLCRLVFTCYLFDRGVIGEAYLQGLRIQGQSHLRDILNISSRGQAKIALYQLFKKLGEDFNGDLFSDNLDAEAKLVLDQHIETLDEFFQGTSTRTGQKSFWPYDFAVIPIETISAIYETFLSASDERAGAFYTPRFLAEVVLDTALKDSTSLIGKRFLDPACGSGIFLVGLFNRIAEEWKQANPTARNPKKAKELMRLLRESLFGVDINRTACRITAFSLYLAYLDQLSPRDIQELQEKGRALPRLVASEEQVSGEAADGNIRCADFFDESVVFPSEVSVVIGNPPWGSTADSRSPAGRWCAVHKKALPDNQIAAAFIWKAVNHVAKDGKVCLVLPHGVLFNHSTKAILFQKAWVRAHAIESVLNLADFQRFLFERAGHPAVVVSYRTYSPANMEHTIEYWSPKTDWTVTRAEVISVAPQDRTKFSVGELLQDLDGPDAPQVWKRRYWATPRDWQFLNRLSLYPRLRDHTRGPIERSETKRWTIGEGFQPMGTADDSTKGRQLELTSKRFIPASAKDVDLFLLPRDCTAHETRSIVVRRGSNTPFLAPHVLVSKGYTSVAFADFDVSFQHALRGIHGPAKDRELLVFLAAYLRTPVAKYYLFHTSSNWGISRQEVHVEELLRLPFPMPDQQPDPKRCWQIVRDVARIVTEATKQADAIFADRAGIVGAASAAIEPLIEEYLDILPMEKFLIEDTDKVIIPSVRPTRVSSRVPTMMPSTHLQRTKYCERVCRMLNDHVLNDSRKHDKFTVRSQAFGSDALGMGMVVFEKVGRADAARPVDDAGLNMLQAIERLRRSIPKRYDTLDPVRRLMVFDRNRFYVVKPIGQRYWTQTAAMNDADDLVGKILAQPSFEDA